MNKKIALIVIAAYFCATSTIIYSMETPYLNCFQDIYLLNTLTTGTSQESLAIRAAIQSFKKSTETFNKIYREQLKHMQHLAELSAITTTCLPD